MSEFTFSVRNGILPVVSVNKKWQSSVITATANSELVRPEGTKEGKEYLPSSSHQTAATPMVTPEETQDMRILASDSCFPGGTTGKEPACQCRRHREVWV